MRKLHAHTDMQEQHTKHVQFSHVLVFSHLLNVQKHATKSDTSGHCLVQTNLLGEPGVSTNQKKILLAKRL